MATKYEQALALSKEKNIPVSEAVAQIRNQASVSATSAWNQMQYEINKQNLQNMANAQREQFLKLRREGVDPVAARKQAYGEIVSPVAPTTESTQPLAPQISVQQPAAQQQQVAPTPEKSLREQMAGMNVNERRAFRESQGPVQSAQVATIPEPSPAVATEAVRAEKQIDYNVGLGREQEILKNLESFKQQGITDAEAIKRMSGYVTATPEKKAIIDSFNAKLTAPMNEADIFNSLVSGTQIQQKNTPDFRRAQFKYNKFKRYNSMTPSQMVESMKQGDITSEMDSLLASNPNYVQAKQQFDQIKKTESVNATMNNVAKGIKWEKIEPKDYLQELSDKLITSMGLTDMTAQEAFKKYVSNDPKVIEYGTQLSNINRQVAETTQALNEGFKSIKSQYGDLPASALITLMQTRFNDATDTLNALNSTKSYLEADLKNATELAKAEYDAVYQDIQQAQKIRWAVWEMQMKQAFEKYTQEQALNDPVQATQNIIDQYKKLGIIAQRSDSEIIQDVRNRVARGEPLSSALTRLNEAFQSKPEFKRIQEMKAWELSDIEKIKLQAWIEDKRAYRDFNQQIKLAQAKADIDRQNFLFELQNDPEKIAKWQVIQNKLDSNGSLYDVLWKNVATYEWNRGHDMAGKIWDPLPAGGEWTVLRTITDDGKWPYGNSVVMKDKNGNEIRYSHLDSIWVKPGQTLAFWDIIWTRWNTGNVKWASWEILTPEQKRAGRGAHVDIEIKDPSGKLLKESEQVNFLKGLKPQKYTSLEDIVLPEKIPEWKAKSFQYGIRMDQADKIIADMEDKYKNSWSISEYFAPRWIAPEFLKTADRQKFEQARRNFINAVLRQESGAVISDQEFANAEKQYFPQAWDSDDVINQKRENRRSTIIGMLSAAWKTEDWENIKDIWKSIRVWSVGESSDSDLIANY